MILAAALVATAGTAQTDRPEWETDLFEKIERAADEYNTRGGFSESSSVERWLLRSARINLHVREGESTATYSFRIDERLRVTEFRRGGRDDSSFRVRTTRETVERIVAADNKDAAIHRGIRTGRIRVERVVRPLGVEIAVGVEEVGIGLVGLGLLVFGVTKFGIGGVVSLLTDALQRVVHFVLRAARTIWENLAGIATGLTILEQLGLLDRLKRAIAKLSAAIRRTIARMRNWVWGSPPETEDEQ